MLPGIERMLWYRENLWSQEARDLENDETSRMERELREITNKEKPRDVNLRPT